MERTKLALAERRRRLFKHAKSDAVLLLNLSHSLNPNVLYYLGFDPGDCALLLERNKLELFVRPLALAYARRFFPSARKFRRISELAKHLAGYGNVGLDYSAIGVNHWSYLKQAVRALPKSKRPLFKDASQALLETRSVKDEREIKLLKKSALITVKAIEEIASAAGSGRKSESRLANEFAKVAYDNDAKPAFCIVASGRNSNSPHSVPSDKPVKRSEPLMVDAGVAYEGYVSDVTDCFNLNGRQGRQYEALKEIFGAAKEFIRPGVSQQEVFAFAKRQFKPRGLPEIPHGIGHGVGLEVHELPSFSMPRDKKEKPFLLKPGMAFTIEPACYFKNYGLRYERMLVLKEKSAEFL
jgi:Xaa-Pro aminopeptidase